MNWQNISDNEIISIILLVLGTIIFSSVVVILLRKSLNYFITRFSKTLKVDPTNFSFIKNSISFIIYSIALIFIFYKIPYLNALGTALFAGAGVMAVVIGFAAQKAFANIISGVFILMFKPFRMGDTVEITGSFKGVIEDITLRHIVIKDYNNRRVIIPNSIISDQTIINSNAVDDKIRQFVEFGISYDSDIDKAIEIIRDEAVKHKYFIDNRSVKQKNNDEHPVLIRVVSLGDFSVNLRSYVWAKGNDNAFTLKFDLLKSVKERFDREGIEIPFPYRTIVYKNDLKKNK